MGKGKVAIFCGRRREVAEWSKRIRVQFKGAKDKPAIDVLESTGEDSGDVRDAKRVQFMEHPGPVVLVVTTDAWGESIDLQDMDVQCVTQLPHTPRQVFQTEGRGRRLGQERPITIVYPVAEGTLDERLSAIMLEKLPDVEATSDHAESAADLGDRLLGGVPDPETLAAELLELLGVEP
jgi:superfamily II DNA helicase RecQ